MKSIYRRARLWTLAAQAESEPLLDVFRHNGSKLAQLTQRLSEKPLQAATRYLNGACDFRGARRFSSKEIPAMRTKHSLEFVRQPLVSRKLGRLRT